MEQSLPEYKLAFEPPLLVHYLSGGLSLLVSRNNLNAVFAPRSGIIPYCSCDGRIDQLLNDQPGVRVLGIAFNQSAEEMQDPVISKFILPRGGTSACRAHAQQVYWEGLGNTLGSAERRSDSLVANRVSNQFRVCTFRFERLAAAYRTVLSIVGNEEHQANNALTNNKYAQYVGNEYRSLLNELYGLRDALLGAFFRILNGRTGPYESKKVRSLVKGAQHGAAKMILDSMFAESGDRLIEHMTLYRSVALHCLGDNHPIFGDGYKISESVGVFGHLPMIVYPLYDDIERMRDIEKDSSKGTAERLPREEAERFLSLKSHIDALEFCFDCYVRLLSLSEAMASEIPLKPQPFTLTDKDILELTMKSRDGTVRRFKQSESGNLVEV